MKKMLSVLLATTTLLLAPSSSVTAQYDTATSSITETTISDFYNEIINDPSWQQNPDRIQRGEALQLPDEILEKADTATLVEAVLGYPFFSDVHLFDNTQVGYEILYDSFNGMRELASRADAPIILLEKYINEPVDNEYVFRLNDYEILLAQDFVINSLSEEQMSILLDAVSDKCIEKSTSSSYSDKSARKFYDMAEITVDDEAILTDIRESASTNATSGTVKTPNGTSVAVTVHTTEPLTAGEIVEYNKQTDTEYPAATRLRSATGKYNCHSYGWYSTSSSNNRWMPNPSAYWTDGSYSITTNPQVGYRMVWFRNGSVQHTGIVTTRLSGPPLYNDYSSLVKVTSKWGKAGLFEHLGTYSPYTYCDEIKYYN